MALFFFRTYTAAEALDLLQSLDENENDEIEIDDDVNEIDIALVPPYEPNGISSDEDSDEEDAPKCNLNRVGRGCLTTECEVIGLTEKSSNASKPEKIKWTNTEFQPSNFPSPSHPVNEAAEEKLSACEQPIDYLNLFLPDSLIELIVNERTSTQQPKEEI